MDIKDFFQDPNYSDDEKINAMMDFLETLMLSTKEKISIIKKAAEKLKMTFHESCKCGKQFFKDKRGVSYFYNFKYREWIIIEFLGLDVSKTVGGPHGIDTSYNEIKTITRTLSKKGKIRFTSSSSLGQFGRIDKENKNDEQDVYCGIFDHDENLYIIFKIINDDNFKRFRNSARDKKRKEMEDNKNIRDTLTLHYGDLEKYNIRYALITLPESKGVIEFKD